MERCIDVSRPTHIIYKDGTSLEVFREDTISRPLPGKVAIHEAYHIEAAGDIVSATIIRDGDALGTTVPVKLTAAAAGAPAGEGCEGGGMDLFIAQHVLGVSPESAMSKGRAAVAGEEHQENVIEIATLLEERKTIRQGDVNEGRENVRKRKKGIHPVVIKIIRPDGHKEAYTSQSEQEKVWIKEEQITDTLQEEVQDYPFAA